MAVPNVAQPLKGRRVLVPRAAHQAEGLAEPLRRLGAEPLCLAVLRLLPPSDPGPLAALAQTLAAGERPDWLVFTSRNGVDAFFAALRSAGADARALQGVRLAAIGPATAAALARRELIADLVPDEYRGEAVASALLSAMGHPASCRVVIPRAEVAREALPEGLRAAGCRVDVVPAYRTGGPDEATAERLRALFAQAPPDAVCFTSPSTVRYLLAALGEPGHEQLGRTLRAAIGPVTGEALEAVGLPPHVRPSRYTAEALAEALAQAFAAPGGPPAAGHPSCREVSS